MSRLKVFAVGGFRREAATNPDNPRTQTREIVAATSQKEAVRLFNASGLYMTIGELRNYGNVTGNPQEVETAMAQPGQVFWRALDDMGGDFTAAQPKGADRWHDARSVLARMQAKYPSPADGSEDCLEGQAIRVIGNLLREAAETRWWLIKSRQW